MGSGLKSRGAAVQGICAAPPVSKYRCLVWRNPVRVMAVTSSDASCRHPRTCDRAAFQEDGNSHVRPASRARSMRVRYSSLAGKRIWESRVSNYCSSCLSALRDDGLDPEGLEDSLLDFALRDMGPALSDHWCEIRTSAGLCDCGCRSPKPGPRALSPRTPAVSRDPRPR